MLSLLDRSINAADVDGYNTYDSTNNGENTFKIRRFVDVPNARTLRLAYVDNGYGSSVSSGAEVYIDDSLKLVAKRQRGHTVERNTWGWSNKTLEKIMAAPDKDFILLPDAKASAKLFILDMLKASKGYKFRGARTTVKDFIANYLEALTVAIKQESSGDKKYALMKKYRDFSSFLRTIPQENLSFTELQSIYSKVNSNLEEDGLKIELDSGDSYGAAQHEMRLMELSGDIESIKELKDSEGKNASTVAKIHALAEELTSRVADLSASWSNENLANDYIAALETGLKELGIDALSEDQIREIFLTPSGKIKNNVDDGDLESESISKVFSSIQEEAFMQYFSSKEFKPTDSQRKSLEAIFGEDNQATPNLLEGINDETLFFREEHDGHSNLFAINVAEDQGFIIQALRIHKKDNDVSGETLVEGTVQKLGGIRAESVEDFKGKLDKYNLSEAFRHASTEQLTTLDKIDADIIAVSELLYGKPSDALVESFLIDEPKLEPFNKDFGVIESLLSIIDKAKNQRLTPDRRRELSDILSEASFSDIDVPKSSWNRTPQQYSDFIEKLKTKRTELLDDYRALEAEVKTKSGVHDLSKKMRAIAFADLSGGAYQEIFLRLQKLQQLLLRRRLRLQKLQQLLLRRRLRLQKLQQLLLRRRLRLQKLQQLLLRRRLRLQKLQQLLLRRRLQLQKLQQLLLR